MEPATAVARRISVRSAPLESARVVGSKVYHEHTVTALERGTRPELSIEAIARPNMTVGLMGYTGGVRIESNCLDGAYQVNIPLSDTFRAGSGDARARIGPGCAALYRRGEAALLEGWSRPTTLIALKLAGDRLHELARELAGRPVPTLDLPLELDLTSTRGREWLALLRVVANPARDHRSFGESAAVGDLLETPIINGLLLLSGAIDADAREQPRDAPRSSVLQPVVEFIEQHAELPLTVSMLATVGGMSVRSLQLAFREQLGTTPLAHLRGVRLDRAHADLSAPTLPRPTVGDVARRWGFRNMGRFAAAYAERFDETPKATLRKSEV